MTAAQATRQHLIPQFAAPPVDHRSQLDPPLPEDQNQQPAPASSPTPDQPGPLRRRLSGLITPKQDTDDRSTPISSSGKDLPPGERKRSKPTAREVAEVVTGILSIVVVAAAFAVEWGGRRELRKPTDPQYDAIATPIAKIVAAHADADWLHPDLINVLATGNALGAYLQDGPLITTGQAVDNGMPANLQEESA